MSWIPGATMSQQHQQWNRERGDDEPRFLGTISDTAMPAYYVPAERSVQTGTVNDDGELERDDEGDSWAIEAEEQLGDFLERVGEERGWDSLSDWAREHLEHEETAEEASTS